VSSEFEVTEIQRRMAQIRRGLHDEVQQIVVNSKVMTDWRHYVRVYPWASVGAAVAVGYLMVPRRHPVPTLDRAAIASLQSAAQALNTEGGKSLKVAAKEQSDSIMSQLFKVALRSGLTFAAQRLMPHVLNTVQQQVAQRMEPESSPSGDGRQF